MDKADDFNGTRDHLAKDDIESVISSNRKQTIFYYVQLHKERNKVERFFCKLKEFRRFATRHDKLQCSFFAFAWLATAFISLK